MNGVGGDLFAIVYDAKTKTVRGLNASGRAPASATPAEFQRRKLDDIPYRGVLSVSVPGVVDGWHELLAKHGTISLARALEPAIGYARDGFAVSEIIAHQWKASERVLSQDPAAAAAFLPGSRAPAAGDVFRNPQLATTLEQIARGGRDAFYKGPIADAIAADMKERNGLVTAADLAAHRSDWLTPLSTTYRGYEVLELPPNTQGIVALQMLNILEGFDIKSLGHNSAAYLHHLVEAKRIAFADRAAWLADLQAVPAEALKKMLSKEYAAERRREIDPNRAAQGYNPLTLPGGAPIPEDPPVAHGDRPAQPGQPVHAGGGTSQRPRSGQAAVPHARARDGAQR
jgi:gamma-glutamyltranspeptidase/glutathione hydrolase